MNMFWRYFNPTYEPFDRSSGQNVENVEDTNDWVVPANINMDDMNHPCSVEHRDERGIFWNTTTDKLNLKNKLKGLCFVYLT